MKELVEVMAKALVEHPEEVVVTETVKGGETIVEMCIRDRFWTYRPSS